MLTRILMIALLALSMMLVGCKKKAEPAAAPPPAEQAQPAQPAAEQPAPAQPAGGDAAQK